MKKNKTLILLDIDGTLLDEKYNINSENIFSIIDRCTKEGIIFGLNSNRALEDLIPVYEQFRLNGFIIGENGAFIYFPENKKIRVLVSDTDIIKIKNILPKELGKEYESSKFLYEDTVSFIKNNPSKEGRFFFIANKFRKYSMSIHIKEKVNNRLIKNLKLAKEIALKIKKIIKENSLSLNVSVSEAFGNILITNKKCNKFIAFEILKDEKYSDYTTVMIGDDMADEPLIGKVDFFYAVGNAEKSVKDKAKYVSSKVYTKGVADILLNKILD